MIRCARVLTLAVLLAVAGSAIAEGVTVSGVFNTGFDASGNLLVPGSSTPDAHYSMTLFPAGSGYTSNAYALANTFGVCGPGGCTWPAGFPYDTYWMPNTASSLWLSPTPTLPADYSQATGQYAYAITFQVTGPDADKLGLTGRWSTDNEGDYILVNGNKLGTTFPAIPFDFPGTPTQYSFSRWTSFTIPPGMLKAGDNTIEFWVTNEAGGLTPTGFRAEFTIPFPPTGILVLVGVVGLGIAALRRQRARAA